jgi:SAM-dependent methyltransferase
MRLCIRCDTRFDGIDWTCPRCAFAPSLDRALPVFAPDLADGNPTDGMYHHGALSRAEAEHFWFDARRRLIVWAIRRHLGDPGSVLDVGCGNGGVLAAIRQRFPAARLYGCDALYAALALARPRLPDATLVQLDIRRLPFDREFDVVTGFDVLEHLDDDELVLRQMHRAAKVGGGLVVTVPQHRWLWSDLDVYSGHRRRYTRRVLADSVRRAGFTIVAVTSFMTLVLPALGIARFRKRRASLDPEAELQLPRAANGGLRALCALERAAIVRGLSFPIGGSLLLIGRRTA